MNMQVSALDMIRHAKPMIARTTVVNSYHNSYNLVSDNKGIPAVTRFPAMSRTRAVMLKGVMPSLM